MSELASPCEIIEEARQGRLFILVDDEDRENEGDLVIMADFANADAINFMAKYARGLVCLAMTKQQIEKLGLERQPRRHESRFDTAFTVSIEARKGVSTGISAADRAKTIAEAIRKDASTENITTPGHIFPIMAREGGVLIRAGHTEGVVDIARLAGLTPAGVICEIMKSNGEMARLPDLKIFAKEHGLKLGTIRDLIAYRRQHDCLIERVGEGTIQSCFGGEFRAITYRNSITGVEHLALIKGDIHTKEPLLVRVQTLNLLDDVLGGIEGGGNFQKAMQIVKDVGRGVVVLLREPPTVPLAKQVFGGAAEQEGKEGVQTEFRNYGSGAQILVDLGVEKMILLSNTEKHLVGLDGYGLSIVGRKDLTPSQQGLVIPLEQNATQKMPDNKGGFHD